MKTYTTTNKILLVLATMLTLSACTNTEVGTAVGGATGAGLGYAVGGGWGSVIGGGAGALIGNQIGSSQTNRYYQHRYYRNGYRYGY